MILKKTEDAVNTTFTINRYNRNSTLRVIGLLTTETITIEQPRVDADILDKDVDAHWTPVESDSDEFILSSTNNNIPCPFTGGPYRLKKLASVGNAYGLELV